MLMYEITVSEPFADWFEQLSAVAAERVAGCLEVIRATAPAIDPSLGSPLLLWFDGMGTGELPLVGPASAFLDGGIERYRELLAWHSAALRYLESQTFRDKLAALDDATAKAVLAHVAEVRKAWRSAQLEVWSARPGQARIAPLLRPQLERLRGALESALGAAGLDAEHVLTSESGLRELTVTELTPELRVIYGLDLEARRILALVGEPLARAYYGDTVRLAERAWQDYRRARQPPLAELVRRR